MTACAYPQEGVLFECNDCDFAGAKAGMFGLFKKSFLPRRAHHFNDIRQERLLKILSGRAASMRHRK